MVQKSPGSSPGRTTIKALLNIFKPDNEAYVNLSGFFNPLNIPAVNNSTIISIMIGPPGAGKTMLAKRIPTIIPPLTLQETLETTKIHSVAGKIDRETSLITKYSYRNPHHTTSDVAICY